MTPLLKQTMKNLIIISLALVAATFSSVEAKNVDLRLSQGLYDAQSSSLFVNVEIKYNDNGNFVLGGQNFRMYYNTEVIRLDADQSNMQLPLDKYSDLQLTAVREEVDASRVGQLQFDDNLGFANLSINLADNKDGGIRISKKDGWVKIATLKFEVINDVETAEVVWGRNGKTEQYATAYAEIAEWVAPFSTTASDVNFIDLSLAFEDETYDQHFEVQVGPNPASDFIKMSLSQANDYDMDIFVRDLAGRIILEDKLNAGESVREMNIAELTPATYIVDLIDQEVGKVYTHKIMKAN